MKRIIVAIVVGSVVAAFAAAQTTAEAAAKEKERREAMRGKTVTPVTNADLSKTKGKPAVDLPPAGDAQPQVDAGEAERKKKADAESRLKGEIEKKFQEMKTELEDRAAKAKERAGLLDLKLRSLQQKFMTFNSMQTKDQVQREIAQAYQMLQAAGAEQAKAKDDLDTFLALAAKDKAAAVGIK